MSFTKNKMFEEEIATINIELRKKEQELNHLRTYTKFFPFFYKEDEKMNWKVLIISALVYIAIISLRKLVINPILRYMHTSIVILGLAYFLLFYWNSSKIDQIKAYTAQLQKQKEDYEYEIKHKGKRGK